MSWTTRIARLAAVLIVVPMAAYAVTGLLASAERFSAQDNAVVTKQAVASGDFAGAETCATCHAQNAKGFITNPHSRIVAMHGTNESACEACHGPGKAHAQSEGDLGKIFRFTKATAKQIDAKCLECHANKHGEFERSTHGEANVSCLECHSNHKASQQKYLLKAAQPTLCYGCHADVKPEFSQPFHHKVDEGLMSCSDCHNPHGPAEKNAVEVLSQQNAACVQCHTEFAGPFAFEHPPVKGEGCTSCHSPHSSVNPRLLTKSSVNTLCFQCHTGTDDLSAPGKPSFHPQADKQKACNVCHTQVHGSNTNAFFLH